MDSSDQALLARTAAGDQAAFAAFYDRHAPRVLGLITRLVGRGGEAEDVLQETFWQVWARARDYDPQRSGPLVWLSVLARSRALDHLRRRSAAPAGQPLADGADRAADAAGDPVRRAESGEWAAAAGAALAGLPAEQRRVLELSFFGGLSHDQIAARELLPLGTVKTRIRLGVKRLQEALQQHGAAHQ